MTIRTLICIASALAMLSKMAVAAPVNVVDRSCKEQRLKECVKVLGADFDSPFSSIGGQINAVNKCDAWAEYPCYTSIDVPTRAEINAMMAENSRLQREQWAAWLKVLEETGVVKPPVQLAPPPTPTRKPGRTP